MKALDFTKPGKPNKYLCWRCGKSLGKNYQVITLYDHPRKLHPACMSYYIIELTNGDETYEPQTTFNQI